MVKEIILKPFLIVALVLYMSVHLSRIVGLELPSFINSYLTDLLCMPLILSLSCAGVRVFKRNNTINLTFTMVFAMTFFYAFYFEWFLPLRHLRYTADWIDVCCYFAGALVYWKIIQPLYLKPIEGQNELL